MRKKWKNENFGKIEETENKPKRERKTNQLKSRNRIGFNSLLLSDEEREDIKQQEIEWERTKPERELQIKKVREQLEEIRKNPPPEKTLPEGYRYDFTGGIYKVFTREDKLKNIYNDWCKFIEKKYGRNKSLWTLEEFTKLVNLFFEDISDIAKIMNSIKPPAGRYDKICGHNMGNIFPERYTRTEYIYREVETNTKKLF
jgi:hypothetical protein